MSAPLILLCAGGTGGHVFPARALAEELLARGYRVAFACDTRGIKYLDGLKNVDVHVISAGPVRAGLRGKFTFALSLLKGYAQSHALISKLKPAVAVGFGGYPCAPPMFAAQHRFIPTILHEQNAVLGAAHKLLAPMADIIALSHEKTRLQRNGWAEKSVFTGNPVRADIIALRDDGFPPVTDEINLLIFGGSLGAASFAQIVPHAVIKLAKNISLKLNIVHQARESDLSSVEELYREAGLKAEIKSFFDDIPQRLAKAHLLICRSGASTIAENICAGRPAIYIPYPWHKDRQQFYNAETVAEIGGGWIVEEKDLTPERLYQTLELIVPGRLGEAAAFARSLGQPDAVLKLADQVVAAVRARG